MSEELDLIGDPEDSTPKAPTTESAYPGSAPGRKFLDKDLEGWSGRRRAAAFEIGFTGSGSVVDPVRVVYTCVVTPAELGAIFRNGIAATERFLQWAEENKCLDPSMENWQAAYEIAEQLVEEVEKSEFEVKDNTPGGGHLGNLTGQQS